MGDSISIKSILHTCAFNIITTKITTTVLKMMEDNGTVKNSLFIKKISEIKKSIMRLIIGIIIYLNKYLAILYKTHPSLPFIIPFIAVVFVFIIIIFIRFILRCKTKNIKNNNNNNSNNSDENENNNNSDENKNNSEEESD